MKSLIEIACWVLLTLNLANQSVAQESGSIIPLYIYPQTKNGQHTWKRLFDAHRANPVNTWAIVNVNSGPETNIDDNYAKSIPQLHSAGIKTLGYVSTRYAGRSQAEVKSEVDRWKSFHNVNGIFFDEMSFEDNDANVTYYRELNDYAKSQGFTFTVGNPGTETNAKYFNTVDNIVIFETYTGFPSKNKLCSQNTNGKGRTSVSIMPYKIRRLNKAQIKAAKACVGFIYVTDDALPNPWDTLPRYLSQLFESLKDENSARTTESGSIIPLYSHPNSGIWQKLLDAHRTYPIPTWAIVNPSSGPGSSREQSYVNSIQELRSAGINVMGYVHTSYAKRSQSDVRGEMDRWKAFYNVQGIFFDEMTSDGSDVNLTYYRDVTNYAKAQGFTFTVGNPGNGVDPKYFNVMDNVIIFESDTGFPSKQTLCSQNTNGKGKESTSIIPYNIPTLNEAQVREAKECVGWIYVTDDVKGTDNNPWDTLPSYLTQLFGILKS